jgi:hypothetical protein
VEEVQTVVAVEEVAVVEECLRRHYWKLEY